MAKIPKKTLEDLEYFEVLRQCSGFAITPLGKEACLAILPVIDENQLVDALNAVSEFKSSFENENRIPNHGFEPLISVFSLLSIEIDFYEVYFS